VHLRMRVHPAGDDASARRLFGYACPNRWTMHPPLGR
jgi:hypothetical protein